MQVMFLPICHKETMKESYQGVQGAGLVQADVGLVGREGMPGETGKGAVAVGAFLGRGGFLLVAPIP